MAVSQKFTFGTGLTWSELIWRNSTEMGWLNKNGVCTVYKVKYIVFCVLLRETTSAKLVPVLVQPLLQFWGLVLAQCTAVSK